MTNIPYKMCKRFSKMKELPEAIAIQDSERQRVANYVIKELPTLFEELKELRKLKHDIVILKTEINHQKQHNDSLVRDIDDLYNRMKDNLTIGLTFEDWEKAGFWVKRGERGQKYGNKNLFSFDQVVSATEKQKDWWKKNKGKF